MYKSSRFVWKILFSAGAGVGNTQKVKSIIVLLIISILKMVDVKLLDCNIDFGHQGINSPQCRAFPAPQICAGLEICNVVFNIDFNAKNLSQE